MIHISTLWLLLPTCDSFYDSYYQHNHDRWTKRILLSVFQSQIHETNGTWTQCHGGQISAHVPVKPLFPFWSYVQTVQSACLHPAGECERLWEVCCQVRPASSSQVLHSSSPTAAVISSHFTPDSFWNEFQLKFINLLFPPLMADINSTRNCCFCLPGLGLEISQLLVEALLGWELTKPIWAVVHDKL